MVLYRNTKSFVRFPDGETEFLDILAEVLQGDTLTPFLFIICLDYVLTISVDKCNEYGRTLELERSRRLPTKKITDAVILLIIHISIVTAIMVLYRNTKSLVRSSDGELEFFDILARVLQGVGNGDTRITSRFILR